MPSGVLDAKIPYELLFKRKASLEHIRVLRCLCYATTAPRTDKFRERATTSILMGFSETQKGYILMDLKRNQFFVSRDVSFSETEFPF